jgi:hypothetical protein
MLGLEENRKKNQNWDKFSKTFHVRNLLFFVILLLQ